VVLSDTGNLDSTGGAKQASLLNASVAGLLSGQDLHATSIGGGSNTQSEASLANLVLNVAGNTIGADFVMARAKAYCPAVQNFEAYLRSAEQYFQDLWETAQPAASFLNELQQAVDSAQARIDYESNWLAIYEFALDRDDEDLKIVCYTDHQLFQRYHKYKVKQAYNKNKAITLRTLRELQPGDYVTHIDHGVGTYSGLQKIEANGRLQEAVRLASDPGSRILALTWLGYLSQETQQYADAFASFRAVLAIDPAHREALYEIGRTAVFSGLEREAGEAALRVYLRGTQGDDMPSAEDARKQLERLLSQPN